METAAAVLQLSSLAQVARLDMFRLLVQSGNDGLSAGDIAGRMQIPASTLSFHLKELSHAGLVSAKQKSRYIYYSANYTVMNDLLAFLTENCCSHSTSAHTNSCITNLPCTSNKP